MIHEISPHSFNNHFKTNRIIGEKDFVFLYNDRNILLKSRDGDFEIPKRMDIEYISDDAEFVFLFRLDNTDCFLLKVKVEIQGKNLVYEDLNFFRTTGNKEMAWIALVGFHLKNWYEVNKFCGKCGAKTQYKKDERALLCPQCGHIIFPSISPAIIVAITCKDKILLARNRTFPGSWYALIAGYADVGESLEETLIREVKEEVGLDVWNIRYYTSQPWPLSGSMMVGFFAEADEKQALCIDGVEIVEAAWFRRGELPEYPSSLSISGDMIDRFEKGEL